MRRIVDHIDRTRCYLLYAARRRLDRRSLQKAGKRGRYARRDHPTGCNLADQFRQDITDSSCDNAAPKAEPARDPAKGGTAERPLDLRTCKCCAVGSAEPRGDLRAEAGRSEFVDKPAYSTRGAGDQVHEFLHQLARFRAKPKPARYVLDRSINHCHFVSPLTRRLLSAHEFVVLAMRLPPGLVACGPAVQNHGRAADGHWPVAQPWFFARRPAAREPRASAKFLRSRYRQGPPIRAEALDLHLLPADLVMHRLDVITADLLQPDFLNHSG